MLPRIEPNFFIGNATGIATLGFAANFITDDIGANDLPIEIVPHRGTVLLGRNYHETVATMCHEYGHLLGLPDLFNTAFLQSPDPGGPENDSAGIGNWGLMGWGTLGWNRNDGPNSFSAWSRLELGWAQVAEPEEERSEVRLEPVALNGQVFKIPIGDREFFLLENRLGAASYYDRSVPTDGLLIWHVANRGHLTVDLECADGRWQEAGFPLGQIADPLNGSDNLDFWSHDRAYTDRHRGNFGDATDPFDGVRFTAFTPQTNPSSAGIAGEANVQISLEDIHYENQDILAQLQTAPAGVRLEEFKVVHGLVDGAIVVGGDIRFSFRLVNQGGVPLRDLQARIVTDDPWIEVLQDGVLGPLAAGVALHTRTSEEFRPRFRFSPDLTERHTAEITLEVRNGDQLLHTRTLSLSALPFVRLFGRVTDPAGQPAKAVKISASRGRFHQTALTDEDGLYEFKLPGGTYFITATRQNAISIFIAEDHELDFVLPGSFQVLGRISNDTPEPLTGYMTFYPLEVGVPLLKIYAWDFGYEAVLPPGRFHIGMSIGGLEGTKNLGIVDIRVSQELDFKVPIGSRVQGRLVDGQGVPVVHQFSIAEQGTFSLSAISDQQATETFWTRPDGTLWLKAVPGIFEFSAIVAGQRWVLGKQETGRRPAFRAAAAGGQRRVERAYVRWGRGADHRRGCTAARAAARFGRQAFPHQRPNRFYRRLPDPAGGGDLHPGQRPLYRRGQSPLARRCDPRS